MYDSIIIGAGPAGLTSAIYLRRANKKVLVLESKGYGGQIASADKVENYPGIAQISGFELAENLYQQAKNMGAEIKFETVNAVQNDKTVQTNDGVYQGKTVIIANGAAKRKLNLKKESDFIGKGISYCATCDGNFFKGKTVAVVGGGNSALEDALYLSGLANKVYVIHQFDEFNAEEKYREDLLKKSNVSFLMESTVTAINGNGKLETITVSDRSGTTQEISIDGLFIAIGQEPKNQIFSNVVDLDNAGYIECENGVYTKTDGIFAAGDTCEKELRQLTTAVSDGSLAATAALKSMKG